jgi:hypothetical protein
MLPDDGAKMTEQTYDGSLTVQSLHPVVGGFIYDWSCEPVLRLLLKSETVDE